MGRFVQAGHELSGKCCMQDYKMENVFSASESSFLSYH
jgi:hypothetical protein